MDVEGTLTPHPSPEIWFDDGNIVLQAEQTLFKVYRGVLGALSPFFHDMFLLPQQETDQSEKYEGCPLIEMAGDLAEDVRVFLKAIFDPQFYSNVKSVRDYKVVVSILKLGNKYQVDHLVRRSLPVFTAIYPASLKNWDIRTRRRQFAPLTALYGKALPIFVIHLARSMSADVLLPAALFECCTFSIEEIIGGVAAADGTPMCLSPSDQALVLKAREALAYAARMSVFSFVFTQYFPNMTLSQHQNLQRVHRWLHGGEQIQAPQWLNPLRTDFPWPDFIAAWRSQVPVAQLRKQLRRGRQTVWDNLPVTFGMPRWDKMQRESMH